MKKDKYILQIQDLCVEINGVQLIDNLDLAIPEGEVHAVLGQNGSGKTTLMMTIMGFSNYKITKGQILFRGEDISEMEINERAQLGIAISLQRPPEVTGVTLRNILNIMLQNDDNPEERLLELAQASSMSKLLDRDINDGLSGGEIKRAELLQLLAMSPSFSMLDEPDSGVDVEALGLVGELMNRLFSRDKNYPVRRNSGIIITHTGNILKYLNIDKAHIMHKGRIGCSGNPSMMLDTIGEYGYEQCINCMRKGVAYEC
jgi:Fe-S cluster assembly ATP-binding protein